CPYPPKCAPSNKNGASLLREWPSYLIGLFGQFHEFRHIAHAATPFCAASPLRSCCRAVFRVFVSAPVASFRVPQAREYWETLPCPPPATVYGMLLSAVGEPN